MISHKDDAIARKRAEAFALVEAHVKVIDDAFVQWVEAVEVAVQLQDDDMELDGVDGDASNAANDCLEVVGDVVQQLRRLIQLPSD